MPDFITATCSTEVYLNLNSITTHPNWYIHVLYGSNTCQMIYPPSAISIQLQLLWSSIPESFDIGYIIYRDYL